MPLPLESDVEFNADGYIGGSILLAAETPWSGLQFYVFVMDEQVRESLVPGSNPVRPQELGCTGDGCWTSVYAAYLTSDELESAVTTYAALAEALGTSGEPLALQ